MAVRIVRCRDCPPSWQARCDRAAGWRVHEAVQHVAPLPQCQPDAFALGGIEVAIDVDGE
jgi:hypothetical protein